MVPVRSWPATGDHNEDETDAGEISGLAQADCTCWVGAQRRATHESLPVTWRAALTLWWRPFHLAIAGPVHWVVSCVWHADVNMDFPSFHSHALQKWVTRMGRPGQGSRRFVGRSEWLLYPSGLHCMRWRACCPIDSASGYGKESRSSRTLHRTLRTSSRQPPPTLAQRLRSWAGNKTRGAPDGTLTYELMSPANGVGTLCWCYARVLDEYY